MDIPDFKEFRNELNESTFVPGKAKAILQQLALQKSDLILNITESPDYGATNPQSEKAIRDINDAWMNFETEVLKAIRPLKRNITGV